MSAQSSSNRFDSLDALKCFCMLMIIPLHLPFRAPISNHYPFIARFAVPVFFMITGFFFELKWPCVSPKKQIIKLTRLLAAGCLLYFIRDVISLLQSGDPLTPLFSSIVSADNPLSRFKDVFLLNIPPIPSAFHLWYLQALLYGWLIIWGIRRFLGRIGRTLLHLSIPFLLLCGVAFSNYSTVFIGYIFRVEETRNFLLCAIPYISLGSLICAHRSRLCHRFSCRILFVLFVLFCLSARAEEYLLSFIRRGPTHDYYFSTAFQAVTIFLLFLQLDQHTSLCRMLCPLSLVGRKHVSTIYIIHLAAAPAIFSLLDVLHLRSFFYRLNAMPLAVFLGSLLISILLNKTNALLRRALSSPHR